MDLAVIEGSGSTCKVGKLMEIQLDGSLQPVVPKAADPPPAIPLGPTAPLENQPNSSPEVGPPVPANGPIPEPIPRAPRTDK